MHEGAKISRTANQPKKIPHAVQYSGRTLALCSDIVIFYDGGVSLKESRQNSHSLGPLRRYPSAPRSARNKVFTVLSETSPLWLFEWVGEKQAE